MSGHGEQRPPSPYPPRPVLPVEPAPPIDSAYEPADLPAAPLPVRPVPVQVQPLPAQPLPVVPLPPPDFRSVAYTNMAPPRERRPGVVSWLGAGSVAAACVGILVSVALTLGAVVFLASADAAGRSIALDAANRATAAPSPPPPAPAEAAGPAGMAPADRAAVIDAFKYLEVVTPRREEQLDAMLAKAGAAIFPPNQVPRTREGVHAAVGDHRELYSANPATQGPLYFKTATGQLEVHDDRAVFRPDDKSPTVRTFAGGPPGADRLTDAQVTEIMNQAQSACGNGLAPGQVSTLRTMLLQPKQTLVPTHRAKSAVKAVAVQPGGATVRFVGGAVSLGPAGQVVPAGQVDPPRVSRTAFGAVLVLAIGLLGLAVYLMVGGIFALRASPRAPRLLAGYAWAKVVATVGLWAATWWMLDDFIGRAVAAAGGADASGLPPAVSGASAWQPYALLFAIAGCLVPAALLLGLRSRPAREYFASRRAG